MYIVTIVPISKKTKLEILSYFSKEEISIGTLVEAPYRSSYIEGLVSECISLNEIKQSIKDAPFNLKKVSTIVGKIPFQNGFLETVGELSREFFIDKKVLLSTYVQEGYIQFYKKEPWENPSETQSHKKETTWFLLEANSKTRIEYYRGKIREYFAKGISTYIAVPYEERGTELKNELEKGIEEYTVFFSNEASVQQKFKQYKKVVTEKHPLLIIGTSVHMVIPRKDTGVLIIEEESSPGYKRNIYRKIDHRAFLVTLASYCIEECIFAGSFISTETWKKHQDGLVKKINISDETEMPPSTIIEKIDTDDIRTEKNFSVLTENTYREVLGVKNKKVLFFTLRNGYAPLTVCTTCGKQFVCEFCKSPLILYKGTDPSFLCRVCKKHKPTKQVCGRCGSWNLKEYGIGIQRTTEEVGKKFPETPFVVFDKEHITTRKIKKETLSLFLTGGIRFLIGTESVLYRIPGKCTDMSIITSFDSLFALPHFKIEEEIIQILLVLKEKTREKIIVQTRQDNIAVLAHFKEGTLKKWRDETLVDRKQMQYPPYVRLIKIKIRIQSNKEIEMQKFLEVFSAYTIDYVEKHNELQNDLTFIIRIDSVLYREKEFYEKLVVQKKRGAEIIIDPETFL